MAPEQLEGKDVDARTDVFALGALLYEMASGRKAFAASSPAWLVTAIMSAEPPPISSIQASSPPVLDRLVKACLAKDPGERVSTAHDVMLQLQWIAEGSQVGIASPGVVRRKNREALAWAAAALAAIVALWFGFSRGGALPDHSPKTVRASLLLPEDVSLNNAVLPSDGSKVVFSGVDSSGKTQLWVRSLEADSAKRLDGTEWGVLPFWSPDGKTSGSFR
jgi:serine/threonine protein kinase